MPERRRRWRIRLWPPSAFAALLALGQLITPAAASAPHELVAMPFACRIERGELHMQRSADRFYRLVGPRDHQSLRICAARAPGQCRTLDIHRFVFDCGGVRVPWIEAAGASSLAEPWRAEIVAGRMTLRFWPGGPIRDRQPPVTLPAGFAPAPASGLRFAQAEQPAVSIGREPAPFPLASAPVSSAPLKVSTRPRADAETAARPADERPAPLKPQPALVEPPEPARPPPPMGFGWTATVALTDDAAGPGRWRLVLPGGTSSTLLVVLGLAALLLSATAVAARHCRAARGPVPSVDQGVEAIAAEPPATDAASAAPPPPPPPLPRTLRPSEPAEPQSQLTPPRTEPPPVPSQPASDWDAVVELETTAAALLEIVQQIVANHVPEGPLREVLDADLVTIAARLSGPELSAALEEGRLDLVHPVYTQAILDLERARTLARIEHERLLEAAGALPRLPETFEDACNFLGVNPRASETVVKKVVDALRQNWHPDLARDEADRATREERIKRINAAWDLIRPR